MNMHSSGVVKYSNLQSLPAAIISTLSARWRNRYGVGLAINRSWVQSYSGQNCVTTLVSCSHLRASVTKQYNLIPAKGR